MRITTKNNSSYQVTINLINNIMKEKILRFSKLLKKVFDECTTEQYQEIRVQYQELIGPNNIVPHTRNGLANSLATDMYNYIEEEYIPKTLEK